MIGACDLKHNFLTLISIGWIAPRDMWMEVIIHCYSSCLVHFTWPFKYHSLVSRTIPWIVVSVTITDHFLGTGSELWEFPTCAVSIKCSWTILFGCWVLTKMILLYIYNYISPKIVILKYLHITHFISAFYVNILQCYSL